MNRTSCMNQNPQMYHARNRRMENPMMSRTAQTGGCGIENRGETHAMGSAAQASGCKMDDCGGNPQTARTVPSDACRVNGNSEHAATQKSAWNTECGMENRMNSRNMQPELPTGNRSQLLNYINEVSFAVYDAMLFLDTHPTDADALAYFRKYSRMRNVALQEYERLFGPLTLDTAGDSIQNSFVWSQQPWPWEGGAC